MKTQIIDFDQSLYKSISSYSTNTILQNCYPVPDNSGRSKWILKPISGSKVIKSVTNITGTGCRGMYRSTTGSPQDGYSGTIYAVFGNTLFRYTVRGTIVVVGTFNSSNISGMCTFAENQAQTDTDTYIYVCDRQTIYKFKAKATDDTVASTWMELGNLPHRPDSPTSYATPAYISWDNYRLIMTAKDSNAWFYTDTGTDTFKETNVYFGESRNDATQRVTEFAGNIWSFGTFSYDIFSRTGNRSNPYSSPKSASGRIGLASPESLAILDDVMVWLGSGDTGTNGIYLATKGGQVKRVSDDGIEEIIKKWKYQSTTYGFTYSDKGNLFYFITSVKDNMTIGYNITTNKWFQCGSTVNGKFNYWDVSNVIYGYNNEIYFGSKDTNDICKFDSADMIDYKGRPIARLWQSPIFIDNLKMFKVRKLVADIETGISTSYTDNDQVFIQLSWDGGITWGDRKMKDIGKKGDYTKQVNVFSGGLGRNLVIRIGTSAHTPVNFFQLRMDIEELGR